MSSNIHNPKGAEPRIEPGTGPMLPIIYAVHILLGSIDNLGEMGSQLPQLVVLLADDLLHLALLLLQHLYRQENITQRRQSKMQMISSSNTCTGEKIVTFPPMKIYCNSEKAQVLHIL